MLGTSKLFMVFFVALASVLAAPQRSLGQKIADLAMDLTKANLNFGLWQVLQSFSPRS